MMFSQYCRIETIAGGVTCSRRQFIKAAHSLLAPSSKGHAKRLARHEWLREGLKQHDNARAVYRRCTTG